MLRSIAWLLLLGSCLGALACQKDKRERDEGPQLGPPIGAQLQGQGSAPTFSIALAVSAGQDPIPLLPQVAGAVSSAVAKCPAFVAESKDAITGVDFTIVSGKLKIGPHSDPAAGVKCITSALEGQNVSDASAPQLSGRVEIKMGAAPIKTP
jgi:hypothetical protein